MIFIIDKNTPGVENLMRFEEHKTVLNLYEEHKYKHKAFVVMFELTTCTIF